MTKGPSLWFDDDDYDDDDDDDDDNPKLSFVLTKRNHLYNINYNSHLKNRYIKCKLWEKGQRNIIELATLPQIFKTLMPSTSDVSPSVTTDTKATLCITTGDTWWLIITSDQRYNTAPFTTVYQHHLAKHCYFEKKTSQHVVFQTHWNVMFLH